MNRGTRIRTIVLAVAIINQAISQVGEPDFGNETANTVYRIVSYIFTVAAAAIAFWYNNDFTEEACIGTGVTRQLKAEKNAEYIGDYFYAEEENDEQNDMETGGQQMGEQTLSD